MQRDWRVPMALGRFVNYEAIEQLSDQELANTFNVDAAPTDLYLALLNEIVCRLDLPLFHTEQGLTPWAGEKVAAFVEEHRTK